MRDKPLRRLAMAVLVVAAGLSLPVVAKADTAGDFLKAMEGNFRGRGKALLPGRSDPEKIVCKVENHFDAEAKALVVSGDCASAQAKSAVKGKLSYSGESVTGSLIGSVDGATITKSYGSVSEEQLVVTTNFVDNATGNLTRTRQVIRLSEKGFSAQFFTYDNASGGFKESGSMDFSQS